MYHPSQPRWKHTAWLLVLLLLSSLMGCAKETAPAASDPLLAQVFSWPGGASYEPLLQTLDQSAAADDVTLSVQEALGDGQFLHLLFALSLPEGADGTPYDPDQIALQDLRVTIGGEGGQTLAPSFRTLPGYGAQDPLYFLASVHQPGLDLSDQDITLSIQGIQVTGEDGTLTFCPEGLSLSWHTDSYEESYPYRLVGADGAEAGTFTLSPLGYSLTLTSVPFADDAALLDAVTIQQKDGQAWTSAGEAWCTLRPAAGTGEAYSQFPLLLNCQEVSQIFVGELQAVPLS